MVIHLIGSGLFGLPSLSINAAETIETCEQIFILEETEALSTICYNSEFGLTPLVSKIDEADLYNSGSFIYKMARTKNVALLLEGDFNHKNHYSNVIKKIAEDEQITIKIAHSASLFNAVGCTGLQLYRFGQAYQIQDHFKETGIKKIYNDILKSVRNMLHTYIYYYSPSSASPVTTASFFLGLKEFANYNMNEFLLPETTCVALSVADGKRIRVEKLYFRDLGVEVSWPRFGFILCSDLHPMEEEALNKIAAYWQKPAEVTDKETIKQNTFHLIGLGLGSPKDITMNGKEVLRGSNKVYLEGYTSTMIGGKIAIQEFHEKEIEIADRELTEERSNEIIDHLKDGDVSFLVVGDPLGATTHTDLLIRVMDSRYNVNIINNASIINAACISGYSLDFFGEIVSIPFWENNWKPDSFFDKICRNLENGFHTLCLLDIKVKEISLENLVKGKKKYEPPRFMSVSQAAGQLLDIVAGKVESTLLDSKTKVIGLARIGTKGEEVVTCTLQEMSAKDLGDPLHSLVICCKNASS